MKKTFAWLDAAKISYVFHDYKKSGINLETLSQWDKKAGWETLLNRKGTTWRKLDAETQATISQASALNLMQAQPSLIKRPVIVHKDQIYVGYTPDIWEKF